MPSKMFNFVFVTAFTMIMLITVGTISLYGFAIYKVNKTCKGEFAKCAGKVIRDFKNGVEGK